ncbi:MAG: zf-HC2 domain-containing protein [Myxococcales bacterium]|nr:zf-HC2 domain-containing protein [Myxococcales bacterium]
MIEPASKPLSCLDVLDRLSDVLDGLLPADEVAQVRAHLAACDACTRFGGSVIGLVADVRQRLAVPPPVEPDFVARVLSRVPSAPRTGDDA